MTITTKHRERESHKPNTKMIRSQTAEIRHGWSVGERHHRARLAMLLQHRLFGCHLEE
jgi:hypothetical protein